MKLWTLAIITLSLAGCADGYSTTDKQEAISVCQGFDCETRSGKRPTSAATHKPTKDEKIRVRQGVSPDFGSDNIYISMPTRY